MSSSDDQSDVATGPRHSGQLTVAALSGRSTCSVDEAARVLGIGRSTAFKAAHDGSLPTLRIAGRLLVPTAKLAAMLGLEDAKV